MDGGVSERRRRRGSRQEVCDRRAESCRPSERKASRKEELFSFNRINASEKNRTAGFKAERARKNCEQRRSNFYEKAPWMAA